MTMLAELLKAVQNLIHDADKTEIIKIPGNRLLLRLHGQDQTFSGDRPAQKRQVYSLDAFRDWVLHRMEYASIEVFGNSEKLTAYASQNNTEVIDECHLKFTPTAQLTLLRHWINHGVQPKDAWIGSQATFRECLDPKIGTMLKTFDGARREETKRAFSSAGDTLGRSIEAKATSDYAELPDVFEFSIPLFQEYSVKQPVHCFQWYDADDDALRFMETTTDMALAIADAIQDIKSELVELDITCSLYL